jgi:hypothetical protein
MAHEFTARMDVANDSTKSLTLWVEPWAHDFTLEPGDSFTLVATSGVKEPFFAQRVYGNTSEISIYIEGPRDISFVVLKRQRELQCGHNRQRPNDGSLPKKSLERTLDR